MGTPNTRQELGMYLRSMRASLREIVEDAIGFTTDAYEPCTGG